MTDVANIKRKIFNLLQKTVENGCSEEEAMTATEKAGELLEFYSLNIHDVLGYDVNSEKFIEKYIETEYKNNPVFSRCLTRLARYCNVKIWISGKHNNFTIGVFGLVCDVEVFEYLFAIIKTCNENEVKNFKKTSMEYKMAGKSNMYNPYTGERQISKKSLLHGFSMGFADGLSNKISKMIIDKNNHLNESRTGTGLIQLKDEMIEKGFKQFSSVASSLKTSYVHRSSVKDSSTYYSGVKAGENVSLNSGVGGTSSKMIA